MKIGHGLIHSQNAKTAKKDRLYRNITKRLHFQVRLFCYKKSVEEYDKRKKYERAYELLNLVPR